VKRFATARLIDVCLSDENSVGTVPTQNESYANQKLNDLGKTSFFLTGRGVE